MTAPIIKTRIDVEPGHVLVDIDLLCASPDVLSPEREGALKAQLAEAVEEAVERFWSGQ